MASPLDALIAWSIRRRAIVLVVAAALLAAGIYATARAPLDVLPDFTPPRVVIQTEAPGMGTSDVEERVTWPLERVLLGTPQTTSIRSSSIAGLSLITMTFSDDAELFRTRQLVAERLQLVTGTLPEGADAPTLEPIAPPIGSLLKFCITSEQRDAATALRTFADWKMRPRLAGLPGVAQVTIHGGLVERFEVRADPRRMREHHVSLEEIERATARSQGLVGAGAVTAGEMRVDVSGEARVSLASAPEELAATAVAVRKGSPVRLGDVADLARGDSAPVGGALCDGRVGVSIQVLKLPWADTLETTAAAEAVIAELSRDLPAGARVEAPVYRQASFVETSVRSVARSMAIGALLVVVVLILMLRSARLAAISLTAIPLSIVAAAAVLVARGASINGMVLGGLAIAVGEDRRGTAPCWRRSRLTACG